MSKDGQLYDTSKEKMGSTVTLTSNKSSTVDLSIPPEKQAQDKPPVKRRAVIIEPVLTLYMAAFAAMAPVQSQYVLSVWMNEFNATGGPNNTGGACGPEQDKNSTFYINQQKAQAASAQTAFIMDLCQGIPAMIVCLFMGSYSDRNGRRVALISPLVGVTLRLLVFILTMVTGAPIWLFFIATFIDGLMGTTTTMNTTCYAYISDTVPKDKRSIRILLMECAQCGLQAGLQLGMGYFIKAAGYLWPLVTLISVHILNLIYVIFFVPESRTQKDPTKKAFTPWMIIESFKTVVRKREQPQSRGLLILCLVGFGWLVIGQTAQYGVENLYLLNTPLCMDSIMLGFWKTARLLLFFVAMALFSRLVLPRVDDIWIVLIGCVSACAYFIAFPLVDQQWMSFLILIPGFGSRMNLPVARTILSKIVSADEQGGLMSCLYVIERLGALSGSAIFNNIYAATISVFRAATHLTMAGFIAVGLIHFMVYGCLAKKPPPESVKDAEKNKAEVISQKF